MATGKEDIDIITEPSVAVTNSEPDITRNKEIYTLKRRAARRELGNKRDVHVTRKGKFVGLKIKVMGLLRESEDVVKLHALGAAITRCCDIALAVEEECNGYVEMKIETGTVTVTDDFEPVVEGYEALTKDRKKSSICIELRRSREWV